jgi:hypothetical protein
MKKLIRKKVYMKSIGRFSPYNVYYVNGYWIRKNLDRRFPNYGSHKTFPFIPKNEFWIDFENTVGEAKYIIINFLAYKKELELGKSEDEAVKIATKIEEAERGKLKWVKKLKKIKVKEKLLRKIRKRKLFGKNTKNIHIYIVNGAIVRSLFNVDFNQGGHDLVYSFIPENEVWIDDDLYKKERTFVLIHELHERKLMVKGWKYDNLGITKIKRLKGDNKKYAHPSAEDLEFWCRHHPRSIKRVLFREIRDNEKLN